MTNNESSSVTASSGSGSPIKSSSKSTSSFLDKVRAQNSNNLLKVMKLDLLCWFTYIILIFLIGQMKARLSGGYFRMINEKLYTCRYYLVPFRYPFQYDTFLLKWNSLQKCDSFWVHSGDDALKYFKEDPSLFNVVSSL